MHRPRRSVCSRSSLKLSFGGGGGDEPPLLPPPLPRPPLPPPPALAAVVASSPPSSSPPSSSSPSSPSSPGGSACAYAASRPSASAAGVSNFNRRSTSTVPISWRGRTMPLPGTPGQASSKRASVSSECWVPIGITRSTRRRAHGGARGSSDLRPPMAPTPPPKTPLDVHSEGRGSMTRPMGFSLCLPSSSKRKRRRSLEGSCTGSTKSSPSQTGVSHVATAVRRSLPSSSTIQYARLVVLW